MSDSVTKTTLDNGLTVVLKEMHHAPVTSFWVWYRVGSRNEIPGVTGISHWVEHMMFKGTPSFPAGQLDRAVSREGGQWNAFTSMDYTAYYETMPSDRIDLALRLESDRMVNTIMTEEEVASERTVIISERHMNENRPFFLLYEELQAAAFRVHSYHHEIIGDEIDLETMTRDDLYSHYKKYYAPNNAIVVAVGDFNTDEMLARVTELFGTLEAGEPIDQSTRTEPPQRGERRIKVKGPGTTSYYVQSYRAPNALHPDFYPLAILNAAFAGGSSLGMFGSSTTNRSSPLYKALVATDLAVNVFGSFGPHKDPHLFTLGAIARDGVSVEELEAAMDAEIERFKNTPITQAQLDKAVKQGKAQFVYAGESASGIGRMYGMSEVVAGDYKWFDGLLENIEKVTIADVERVRDTYFHKDNRVVGAYVPEAEPTPA